MRFSRLALTCYGHFEALALPFDTRPGCINLVVAPNGAGKSVLRQAIGELLFGIHPQTPMGFAYGYPKMRLQAEADRQGAQFGFIRRKGDANTVTDLAGRGADARLMGFLPHREDRKRLERLFMLDSVQLRAGGRALMQTDGDLADALLSGAGDLGSARALAADLTEQRDAAAPTRRKASTAFYEACDQWTAAGARLAGDAVVRPPQIAAKEALRVAAVQDRAVANTEAAAHAATLARLARIRATRQPLLTLDAVEAWLASHPDALVLPAGVGAALAAAETAARDAAKAQAALAEQHGAVLRDLAAQSVDEAVLVETGAIDALTSEASVAKQARTDLPKREAELADSQRALATLLSQLGDERDVAAADGATRPEAEIATARELIQAASAIDARVDNTVAELAKLHRRIAELQDEQAALPEPAQTQQVKALLGEILADGDPARQAKASVSATSRAGTEQASALARVPRWSGGASALLALAVPPETELTRLDEARRKTMAHLTKAADRLEAENNGVETAQQRLAALTGTQPLPDSDAVTAARAHRDRGWRLVEARLAGQPGDEAAYDGGAPLPLAYARAVVLADTLADRRAEETERLATAAALAREIAAASERVTAATAQHDAAALADTQAASAWAARMAMLSLAADAPMAEARGSLAAREAVITAAAALGLAEAEQARLATQHAAWAAALAAAAGLAPTALPSLLTMAQNQVAQAEQDEAQRSTLAKSLRTEQRRLASAQQAQDEAAAAQAGWLAQWQSLLARLGRPTEERPAATSKVLDALVSLRAETTASATAAVRLREMSIRLARFAEQAGVIGARLGMPGQDPAALADALAARLKDATGQRIRRQSLQAQADALLAQLLAAQHKAQAAETELQDAIRATGADDVASAQMRVTQAAERQVQEARRDRALHVLAENGGGLLVAALRTELAALTPDELGAQEDAAREGALTAQSRAQDAAAAAQAIETELAQLTQRHDAAQAALDRQAAASRISRVLEDALVQHTAAAMLERALADVEAQGGTNAKLARIGAVFSMLTEGAYDRVSPAEDDSSSKEHILLQAHEAGGGLKHIAQLSEGTRDQLYLALRIVAIEDHAASAPPLPFLADDILQTFDDRRAMAALQALLALSRHTQVIVLTHHPHLAALAKGLPEGSVHLAGFESPL